jgi:predicted metal-dependent phosphoesterase TrpH
MRIDCHVHTTYSPDSLLQPADLLALASQRGLECLAITDHNTIAGAVQLQKTDSSVRIIVGEEVSTNAGELIGLFLQEAVPPGLSAQRTIELIREQEGLIVLPHPCDRLRHHALAGELWEEILPQVDLVEGLNGRTVFKRDDQQAVKLAQRYAKPICAGSDAHTCWEVGVCGIEVAAFQSAAEFLTVVSQGREFGHRSPGWVHAVTKTVKYANRWGIRKPKGYFDDGFKGAK